MKSRSSGQITVFAAIILLAVIMLAGVLVDISRISAGRAMVKRAADTAAKSLLANYGSRLKEDYGIFAMPIADEEELKDQFEEYITCNLSIPQDEEYYKGSTDLFGFRIESVSITPIFNLSENKVTRQQILEYMKYRAPAELVEGFMERIFAVKEVGRMSEAYKKKVGIDKILGSMDKSQQNLKKNIDGSGNISDKFINGFNLGGSWEAAYNGFNSVKANLSSIKSSLDTINNSISELEAIEADVAGKEADSDANSGASSSTGNSANNGANSDKDNDSDATKDEADTKSKLDNLKSEQSALQQSYSNTSSQLQQIWNEIRYSLTGDYINANENAINEIQKIVEKGKKAQLAIAELEGYLNENFGNVNFKDDNFGDDNLEDNNLEDNNLEDNNLVNDYGSFSEDFKEQTQSGLDGLKALILDGQRAEEMLSNVGENSSLLKNIAARLDEAGINNVSDGIITGGFSSELLNLVKGYKNITYNYSKPDKGDKKDDPRVGKAEAVKDFIVEKILKDVNYKTEGIEEIDLPSATKVVTGSFDIEDAEYENEQQTGNEDIEAAAEGAAYEGNLQNIENEVDLYDEEGMFQENALSFISNIGNLIAGEAAALRDNIYINEYIMGTFRNSVSEIKNGNETIEDTNLSGNEKSNLLTFYDSEVEYVLHGNASQEINNIMTKGELLLVRFGLDTLHVYTDAKKKTMAASIATAVAGWWTGGAGIPIISNLIMCGWGMGEAVIDVKDLMEGKSVPIYKMKGDWKLDVGMPVALEPKTDKRLYFNYHDYLRLFLLTMNENKKLNRVEDLIQLNLGKSREGFKLSECSTYVRVEAEVSMKYLFITQPFVRKAMKTNDGRYVFKVLVYEGY